MACSRWTINESGMGPSPFSASLSLLFLLSFSSAFFVLKHQIQTTHMAGQMQDLGLLIFVFCPCFTWGKHSYLNVRDWKIAGSKHFGGMCVVERTDQTLLWWGDALLCPPHSLWSWNQACSGCQSLAQQRQGSTPASGATNPAPEWPLDRKSHLGEGSRKAKGYLHWSMRQVYVMTLPFLGCYVSWDTDGTKEW